MPTRVSPMLAVSDGRAAIAFYQAAFGAFAVARLIVARLAIPRLTVALLIVTRLAVALLPVSLLIIAAFAFTPSALTALPVAAASAAVTTLTAGFPFLGRGAVFRAGSLLFVGFRRGRFVSGLGILLRWPRTPSKAIGTSPDARCEARNM